MRILHALWAYWKSMHSEPAGGISIKRNLATGCYILFAFVQIFGCVKIAELFPKDLLDLIKFLAVLDAVVILLALGITTLEKLGVLAQQLKVADLGAPVAFPPVPATPVKPTEDNAKSD